MRTTRIGAVLLALVTATPVAGAAQSIWYDVDRERSVGFEWARPQLEAAATAPGAGGNVYRLWIRWPITRDVWFLGELPVSHAWQDHEGSSSFIGGPFVGFQMVMPNPRLHGELGVRLPALESNIGSRAHGTAVMRERWGHPRVIEADPGFDVAWQAGAYSDAAGRAESFTNLGALTLLMSYDAIHADRLGLRLTAGPHVWLQSENRRAETEQSGFLLSHVHGWITQGRLRVDAAMVARRQIFGLGYWTEDGFMADGRGSVSLAAGPARVGLFLRMPLDADTREYSRSTVGATFTVTP